MVKNRTSGYSLVQLLIALALFALLAVGVALVLPRTVASTASTATRAISQAQLTQIIESVKGEYQRAGVFAGFTSASATGVNAVFVTSAPIEVTKTEDLSLESRITVPGLGAAVGDQVLLTNASGNAKLTTVTGVSGSDYQLACITGMPSLGAVYVALARTVELAVSGGALTRRINGAAPATVAQNVAGLQFKFAYTDAAGTLAINPTGAPAARAGVYSLAGLIPALKDTTSIDRAVWVPMQPKITGRFLGCAEQLMPPTLETRLNVTIVGLPGGAAPDVVLGGPDPVIQGARPVSTRAYNGVLRGAYTATAQPVMVGGVQYLPTVLNSPTKILTRASNGYLQVTYAPDQGTLNLSVSGLPSGATAQIILGGPSGRSLMLGNGSTSLLLPSGSYSIGAQPSGSYVPTVDLPSVQIQARRPTTVNVVYAPTSGTLAISVSGLPSGSTAPVTLGGPASSTLTLGNGTSAVTLPPGTYSIDAAPVGTYTATPARSTSNVQPSQTSSVQIVYAAPGGPPVGPPPSGGNPPPSGGGAQVSTITWNHTRTGDYVNTNNGYFAANPSVNLILHQVITAQRQDANGNTVTYLDRGNDYPVSTAQPAQGLYTQTFSVPVGNYLWEYVGSQMTPKTYRASDLAAAQAFGARSYVINTDEGVDKPADPINDPGNGCVASGRATVTGPGGTFNINISINKVVCTSYKDFELTALSPSASTTMAEKMTTFKDMIKNGLTGTIGIADHDEGTCYKADKSAVACYRYTASVIN